MRFIGCLLCVCVMAASAGAVLLSLYVVQVTEDPDGKLDLDEQKLKQTSIVYDRDGNEVNTFAGENNRIWREISAMPENLQNAVIAVEDKDFPQRARHQRQAHHCRCPERVYRKRAAWLQAGRFHAGAAAGQKP